MAAFAQGAKSNFFLESLDIERMRMVLIFIPSVLTDEAVILRIKLVLAHRVGEVEFAQIVNEDVFGNILDSCDVSADILGHNRIVCLTCSVSHHFLSASPIFSSHCPIVVALDVESKEASALDHSIISLLVIFEFF